MARTRNAESKTMAMQGHGLGHGMAMAMASAMAWPWPRLSKKRSQSCFRVVFFALETKQTEDTQKNAMRKR